MISLLSNNQNIPNNCSICEKKINTHSIISKNNKFVVNPNKWDFDILHCGHIICRNCTVPNKCNNCNCSTKVFQFNISLLEEKYWYSLTDYINDYINADCMNRIISTSKKIIKDNKKIENTSWMSLYAMVHKIAFNQIKSFILKNNKNKEILHKKKRIKNFRINKEYDRLLRKYTKNWPKSKTISPREKERLKDQAVTKYI